MIHCTTRQAQLVMRVTCVLRSMTTQALQKILSISSLQQIASTLGTVCQVLKSYN